MVEIFYPDKNGKISFSKEELQELLNRVHDHGYEEGYNKGLATRSPYWWTSPSWTSTTPYITTSDKTTVTCSSNAGDLTTSSLGNVESYTVKVSTPEDGSTCTINMSKEPHDDIWCINSSTSAETTEKKEQKNDNDKVSYDWRDRHKACAPKANKFFMLDEDKYKPLDKISDFNGFVSSDDSKDLSKNFFMDIIEALTNSNKN